jgi:16S rRNA (uracil1498-N3)-methyltransferase
MPTERFFIERAPDGPVVTLGRAEAHHLRDVRRVKAGDEVELFDGSGTDYVGRVATFDRGGVTVEIVRSQATTREADVSVTLAVSVVKQQAMHRLIDMCTQLGLKRLVPMQTERSVAKAGAGKAGRWRRIAIEACKQCGRSVVPEIEEPCDLAVALDAAGGYDVALIASVRPDARPVAAAFKRSARSVLCLVGPEGGFTGDEEAEAVKSGCVPVTLGRSILRTETAAAAILATVAQCTEGIGDRR